MGKKHGPRVPANGPEYSFTLRTDRPWVWRLANLETGETFAFSVRGGKLTLVPEVVCGGPLLLPVRAEGPDGTIGDGAIEIWPGHPQYEQRRAELARLEQVLKTGRKARKHNTGEKNA